MTVTTAPPHPAGIRSRLLSRLAWPKRGSGSGAIAWKAAVIFAPMAILATLAFAAIFTIEQAARDELQLKSLEQIVDVAVVDVNAHLSNGVSDAGFLAEDSALQAWLTDASPANREVLERQFVEFLNHKSRYDSIRVLDASGHEVVRVDVNGAGEATALAKRRMQDKATRYYFRATIGLPRGSTYVSPMDLNIEHGKIEEPIRPTVRFSVPVYSSDDSRRGILVLNYHAHDLLDDLDRKAAGRGGEIWLVNGAGYWMLGPDPSVEWAFMYPDREHLSFANAHPDAWAAMRGEGQSTGTISTGTGRFAFAAVDRSTSAGNPDWSIRPRWYAVAFHDLPKTGGGRTDLAGFLVGTLAVLALASAAIAYHWQRRVEADANAWELAERLEVDNLALAAVNRELEAFSYSVSHDLRTPLRSIDGFSLALVEDHADALDAEGRRYLERIRSAAQRMGQLIDDLLGLARVTRSELRLQTVDVSDLANSVISALEPDHAVAWQVQPGLIAAADSRLLRIVLENLLGNAAKFTARTKDARVTVGSRWDQDGPVYFVRDNGAGFDMEHAGRLFGAFQRLHAAEDYAGTGVGLATVQRIVNRHGGRIWAEAAPGQGATFFFTLGKTGK